MLTSVKFQTSPAGRRLSTAAMDFRRFLVLVVVGSIIFAAGWGVGKGHLGPLPMDRDAHTAGACMALEMAEVYLFMDVPAKGVVAKALTQPINPYRDHFPATSSGMLSLCNDVRAHRYASPDSSVTKLSSR